MKIIIPAAVSEPNKYRVDTEVDESDKSSINEFWNTEKVNVCPGPEAKLPKAATTSTTHP